MTDMRPIQCLYGPHWHEQPGAEEQQARCKIVLYQYLGNILEALGEKNESR